MYVCHTHPLPNHPIHTYYAPTVDGGDDRRDDGAALETRPAPWARGQGHGSVCVVCCVGIDLSRARMLYM